MSAFSDAIQDYFAALIGHDGGDFSSRVNGVFSTADGITADEANWAARPLVELIARSDVSLSAMGILGDLLCRGVNLWGYAPFHLAAMRSHIERAAVVEQAVRAALPAGQTFAALSAEAQRALLDALDEPAKSSVRSWNLLGYYLAPAMPIFQHLSGYRQLSRSMRINVAWLRDAETNPDWLTQLPQLLEDNAESDGPGEDPTATIFAALEDLRRASSQPPGPNSIAEFVGPVFNVTGFVTPDVFNRAAVEMAQLAATCDFGWAGELAMAAGSFVECGAEPDPGADALVAGLPRLLDPTVAFVRACRERATGTGDRSPVQTHAFAVTRLMPQARRALDAISQYCLGTIAHLARSSAARQKHGHNVDLLARLDAVRWDTGNTSFLWKMLQVLNEELIILAPKEKLGWRVKIDGIGDNFQLHALIGGYLVGPLSERKYPGRVSTHDVSPEPDPGVPLGARAIATQTNAPCTGEEPGFASNIQLWNSTALQKDGTLPANPLAATDHFVWNEGVPADIQRIEGTRVILMGESPVNRNWNGGRIFPFMTATFEVAETLSAGAVEAWLERIAAANK